MNARRALRLVAALTMAMAWGSGAGAQDRVVTGLVGAVATAPLSGTADYFSIGPGVSAGAMWNLGDQYGVRVDAQWSLLRAKEIEASRSFDISANMQHVTATFVFQGPSDDLVRPYILAGGGLYRRAVTLSGGAGLVNVCVPWYFVCEPGQVAASRVGGSRSSINPGVTVGIGASVGRFFGEVRYHYALGPSYETWEGEKPATGKFFPLTVGVRF